MDNFYVFARVFARVFLLKFWLVGLGIRRFFPRNGMAARWSKDFPPFYIGKSPKMKRRCKRFINWVIPAEYIHEEYSIEFSWTENPLLAESTNGWKISEKSFPLKSIDVLRWTSSEELYYFGKKFHRIKFPTTEWIFFLSLFHTGVTKIISSAILSTRALRALIWYRFLLCLIPVSAVNFGH